MVRREDVANMAPFPARAGLLSQQVSGGRYFFLKLAPARASRFALIFGGCETCNVDYLVRRSAFLYYGLEYVAEGAGRVRLNGSENRLVPGTVFAYAPETDCVISTDPVRPMVKYFLCLAGADVPMRLTRVGVAPGQTRTLTAHAEVRNGLEDLIREGQHHGRLAARLCAARLEVLLLKIKDLTTHPAQCGNAAEELFLRCKALIDARVEKLGALKEIAAAIGIEPTSVCRLFRRFQGTSPYQYLLRRKMILAAEYLVETGGLVKEAAQRVGFADPYHFSRCFKAVHGVSPRHLREYRRPS
ncbi:MAG: AraC family transcriptional regulator [Opitutaceae bacterium]|jgi:AraC-like DNA-binding protein